MKKRILVIDDDADLGQAVKATLEETGRFEVQWEAKGSHGYFTALRYRPDLILLDIIIPDFGGEDIGRLIKQDARMKHIPVAYITAIASRKEIEDRIGDLENHYLIQKPVNLDQLLQHIEQFLQ